MYLIDKEKVQKILLSQNHKPYQIAILLKNYPLISDDLGELIDHWMDNQEILDIEIDGVSLKDVINNHKSHFLVAIRDLDRLRDPSLTPEKLDQWRRILTTKRYFE